MCSCYYLKKRPKHLGSRRIKVGKPYRPLDLGYEAYKELDDAFISVISKKRISEKHVVEMAKKLSKSNLLTLCMHYLDTTAIKYKNSTETQKKYQKQRNESKKIPMNNPIESKSTRRHSKMKGGRKPKKLFYKKFKTYDEK